MLIMSFENKYIKKKIQNLGTLSFYFIIQFCGNLLIEENLYETNQLLFLKTTIQNTCINEILKPFFFNIFITNVVSLCSLNINKTVVCKCLQMKTNQT